MMALTIDQFKDALPARVKKSLNQGLIDQINTTLSDPMLYESYRENLVSYTSVMADGKFQIEKYIEAVKFVSHKLLGCSNIDAFIKTFPVKHADWVATGVTAKDIASYVTAYNKGKLVNLIFEQTLVPSRVLNQHMYQEALNVQAELMRSAKSEKVRSDAAHHIMEALKMPESLKVELDLGVKEDSAIAQLKETMVALAAQQALLIRAGSMNAQDVAHSRLVIDMGDAQQVGG